MKIVTTAGVAALVGFVLSTMTPSFTLAQQRSCLHGADETPAERARRIEALGLTRALNTAEAREFGRGRTYRTLRDLIGLGGIPAEPAGFTLQLAADHGGYAFSVKDTQDPCRFAYFSDQSGVIYMGQPLQ
jgi:hypothetical protein